MKNKISILLLGFILLNYTSQAQQPTGKLISFREDRVAYMGRVGITDSCAEMYWSGSHVSINVQGTKLVKALVADTRDNNYFYVIVDGNEGSIKKIIINKKKQFYDLATFADKGKHLVELFKITNTDDHITRFYGFDIDKEATVLKQLKKQKRKIEFIGNSITCGHGVDVPVDSADSGAPQYFNNYKAYGAITARHFNAQYYCTAKSGIGIMVSWFSQIMPEIFGRLNPNDPNSKWNFSKYTPGIVVINLFQNDSWLVNQPEHEQFKARFGTVAPSEEAIIEAYEKFVGSVRAKYPKAKIICCLGNMDIVKAGSKWPGYVTAAINKLNDKNVVTHFFKYKDTPGHPKEKEQQAMADELIALIKYKYWN